MKEAEVKNQLENSSDTEVVKILLAYGHELTIQARSGYEFQGAGVTDPRLLRDCNEIQHRVFQAIKEVTSGSVKRFSLHGLSTWIMANERNGTIQKASIEAFKRASGKCSS